MVAAGEKGKGEEGEEGEEGEKEGKGRSRKMREGGEEGEGQRIRGMREVGEVGEEVGECPISRRLRQPCVSTSFRSGSTSSTTARALKYSVSESEGTRGIPNGIRKYI